MSTYITFGQAHVHRVNGKTLDCDCVAKVRDRAHAHELFRGKFCTSYEWSELVEYMHYYPRGVIDVTEEGVRGE